MNDALAGVGWLLTNAVLISTAWRWHRRLFPADGMGFAIIHTVVLCWACVVGVAILFGSIGALSPGLLVTGVCVLCIAARIVLRGIAKRWPQRACAELFAAVDRRSRWWAVAWGLLGSLLVTRVILDGLLTFPMDWDTLAYHLPLVDHWIRAGTLYVPDCAFWYCPGNNEIVGLWCVGLFSGDFLISLNNLPAVVLLAAATVELAGLLNVSRPLCHLAGMAVVATEVTWRQAISAENDIAVAALFFATLVYGLRFAQRRRKADLWLAGISVGLLTGVKYPAMGYAAAAGVSLLVLLAIRRRPRDVFAAAGVGIAGVLVFGAYWYLRNAYFTGAPLYPKGFTASTDLWAKIRPESSTSCLLRSGRAEVWPLYVSAVRKVASVGHVVAVMLLPAVVLWVGGSALVGQRRSRVVRQTRVWFALVMLLATFVCLVTPNIVETVAGTMNMLHLQYHSVRLTLPFVSLCIVGLMVPVSDFLVTMRQRNESRSGAALHWRGRWSWTGLAAALRKTLALLVLWVVAAAVGYQVTTHVWKDLSVDLLLIGIDVFLFGLLLAWSIPFLTRHRRGAVLAAALLLTGVGWGCALSSSWWHAEFDKAYDRWFGTTAFSTVRETDTACERLLICANRYYPFFGSRRQVDVCRPLWLPDYKAFLRYVRDKQATMVVTRNVDSNDHRRYVNVAAWIGEHGETFQKIDGDDVYTWARVVGHERE